jgi:hypothetical protein
MPIELRHRTYFAYLDVPRDVRAKLGRRVFRRTLGTDSRSVASRRAANWIEKWKAEIEQARGRPNANDSRYWLDTRERATTDEERRSVEASMFRDALLRATTDKERNSVGWQMEEYLTSLGFEKGDPEVVRFFKEAHGEIIPTKEHLDEWLASSQAKEKTANMRRATIV